MTFRWIRGEPWTEGAVLYAEELLHGKIHKLKFVVSKIVPEREIVYVPAIPLLRFYFPGNRFLIEPTREGCMFIAEASFRIGKLFKWLAGRKLERGLQSVKKHMREEGENLKKILENDQTIH